MELKKKQPWKSQRDGFQESLKYLQGRFKGEIKSVRTPWTRFNDAGVDGIEWNSTIVIGGRPASGKTLLKDQIIREAFKLNPGENFRVLEFSLEMLAKVSAIREYSALLGKSYKTLCSADKNETINQEDLSKCLEYAKQKIKYPIDIIEEPCTVSEFKSYIEQYMNTHSNTTTVKQTVTENGVQVEKDIIVKTFTKTIITLDHSLLLNKDSFEKDKYDTLYSLGEALTALKRKYPVIFLILTQLNRNIDEPSRAEEGRYGNYILESDIFGADALLQHADMVIGINRPGLKKIRFFGPDKYIIDSDDIMVMHFLKCRNGDTRMSFFKAEFSKMIIKEIPPPPTQERKVKTT
jgi:replicative DNA helicase